MDTNFSQADEDIVVYVTGTWNGFDVLFSKIDFPKLNLYSTRTVSIYASYMGLRIYGIVQNGKSPVHSLATRSLSGLNRPLGFGYWDGLLGPCSVPDLSETGFRYSFQ